VSKRLSLSFINSFILQSNSNINTIDVSDEGPITLPSFCLQNEKSEGGGGLDINTIDADEDCTSHTLD
jgi:hypothetical protein